MDYGVEKGILRGKRKTIKKGQQIMQIRDLLALFTTVLCYKQKVPAVRFII